MFGDGRMILRAGNSPFWDCATERPDAAALGDQLRDDRLLRGGAGGRLRGCAAGRAERQGYLCAHAGGGPAEPVH